MAYDEYGYITIGTVTTTNTIDIMLLILYY